MWKLSNIQVTEAGSITEPVTVADVKEWIGGLEGVSDFDNLLDSMITPAREDIENEIEAKLVDASVSLYVDSSHEDDQLTSFPYALNIPATLTVNKIIRGESPEEMTLDEDYYLNGSLAFANTGRYKLEYDLTGNIPETLKEAIKMIVAYRFANRGDQEKQQGIPEDVMSKIYKYKQTWL